MVVLGRSTFANFEAFTCYNSPYVAHSDARAIDLYPGTEWAPSPVAGEVIDIVEVRAPPKPYAPPTDYLIVIDTAAGDEPVIEQSSSNALLARLLHVEPAVEVGDVVSVGDDLGTLLRAGFFAPWVDNHVHLGFRRRDADPVRASGSLPLELDVSIEPVAWDGTGIVRERAPTFVEVDEPATAGLDSRGWIGIASDVGAVIDGGLPHYAGGGLVGRIGRADDTTDPVDGTEVSLLGTPIGRIEDRQLRWYPLEVHVDDRPITGLSLYVGRAGTFRVKLICPTRTFAVGQRISVSIEANPTDGRHA